MNFFSRYKTILIVLALAVVGFVAYSMLFGGEPEEALVSTEGAPGQSQASQEVLSLLGTLRGIDFDLSVLESPTFRSLQDFSVELVPEPVGRPNPFAPLGVDVVSGGSTQ